MAASAVDLSCGNYFGLRGRLYSNLPAGCRIRKKPSVTDSGNPIFDFTDADLKAALRRAFKITAILGLVLAVVLAIVYGWQTGALLLAGAFISATGLWEWQGVGGFIKAPRGEQ